MCWYDVRFLSRTLDNTTSAFICNLSMVPPFDSVRLHQLPVILSDLPVCDCRDPYM